MARVDAPEGIKTNYSIIKKNRSTVEPCFKFPNVFPNILFYIMGQEQRPPTDLCGDKPPPSRKKIIWGGGGGYNHSQRQFKGAFDVHFFRASFLHLKESDLQGLRPCRPYFFKVKTLLNMHLKPQCTCTCSIGGFESTINLSKSAAFSFQTLENNLKPSKESI